MPSDTLPIEIKKPHPKQFFRVRPGKRWTFVEYLARVDKKGKDIRRVAHGVSSIIRPFLTPVFAFTCINNKGEPFIWKIDFPKDGEPASLQSESAFIAAKKAENCWVNLKNYTGKKIPHTTLYHDTWDRPKWENVPYSDIRDVFDGCKIIANTNDPTIKKVRWTNQAWSSYSEYLYTPHWQFMKIEALEYYGRSCVLCGSTKALSVHHRHYRTLGNERLKDLSVLCRPCHAKHHGIAPNK